MSIKMTEDNLDYVRRNFVSFVALSETSGGAIQHIERLMAEGLLPRASYFPDEKGAMCSNIAQSSVPVDAPYFHPSLVMIAHEMHALLETGIDAADLADEQKNAFVDRYCGAVERLERMSLLEASVWASAFADERNRARIAQSEYAHWLAGTYGLCTRANTPEAVAIKECCVQSIDSIVTSVGEREASPSETGNLERYLRLYDRVAADFAPYERAASSRQRLCVDVAIRFGLR